MPKVYILFDFTEGEPGIGTLSSIFKPVLPENVVEQFAELHALMQKKTLVMARWPRNHQSKSWNITEWDDPNNNLGEPVFRAGIIYFMSGDKDELGKKRDVLIKAKRQIRKELFPSEDSQSSTKEGASQDEPQSTRKRSHEDEKLISDLQSKVARLENELSRAKSDLNQANDENQELNEELERVKSDQPLALIQEMKESIAQVKSLGSSPSHSQQQPNSSSLTPASTPKTRRLVVLDSDYPDIKIEFNALRDAVALGRDGNNKKSLNAMVGVIIDAFYDSKEQALLSLSGKPCKSIAVEKRIQKDKFPVDLKTAIFNYSNTKWNKWYEQPLTKYQTNAAITASLVNSHTAKLRAEAAAAIVAGKTVGAAGGKSVGAGAAGKSAEEEVEEDLFEESEKDGEE